MSSVADFSMFVKPAPVAGTSIGEPLTRDDIAAKSSVDTGLARTVLFPLSRATSRLSDKQVLFEVAPGSASPSSIVICYRLLAIKDTMVTRTNLCVLIDSLFKADILNLKVQSRGVRRSRGHARYQHEVMHTITSASTAPIRIADQKEWSKSRPGLHSSVIRVFAWKQHIG